MANKYEAQCRLLSAQLAEANKLIDAIQNNRTDVFIVKLYPENTEKFELNGDKITDESKVVYGSHKLTFSESVMFKAGKQVATKESEKLIADLQSQLSEYRKTVDMLKAFNTVLSEDLQKYKTEALEREVKLNGQLAEYASQLEDNANQYSELEEDYHAKMESLDDTIRGLTEMVDYWKNRYYSGVSFEQHDSGTTIQTPFGVIHKIITE